MVLDLGAETKRVLGPALADRGFSVDGSSEFSITYRDETRSIELGYYPEDPTPWLNVVLGLRVAGAELLVGLWRLCPEVSASQAPAVGRFDSVESLDARLVTVRDDWLDRLILPAFERPELFRVAWAEQRAETEQRFAKDVRDQRLAQARWAYEHDDFELAVEQFTLAGVEELSAADRRRLVMARRKFAAGS